MKIPASIKKIIVSLPTQLYSILPQKSPYKQLSKLLCYLVAGIIFSSLAINLAIKLPVNASKPIDAILVLGGSIRREIYAAKLSRAYPEVPILISQGSDDPCILLIFRRERTSLDQVWLEKCASSTFSNYYYAVPILRQWHIHKVKLVTSGSHLTRAKIMGKIMLYANGIAVDLELAPEQGVPGNHEFLAKTIVDVSRTLLWAVASQFIQPSCDRIVKLSNIDLQAWRDQKFKCERQGNIRINFDDFPDL